MEKNAKIYVAGHRGMVGSAIVRELMRHRDKTTLKKILNAIEEATEVFGDVSRETFLTNRTLKLAMSRPPILCI